MSVLQASDTCVLAARIYNAVMQHFVFERKDDITHFQNAYAKYAASVISATNRQDFFFHTLELLASLQDSHTDFYDHSIVSQQNKPHFITDYIDDQWVITHSRLPSMSPGDIIVNIGELSAHTWFAEAKKYLCCSSLRSQYLSVFRPYLLCDVQTIEVLDRENRIRRIDLTDTMTSAQVFHPYEAAELSEGEVYIRIPDFQETRENQVIADIEKYKPRNLVIDLRYNSGGSTPGKLIQYLLDKPFYDFAFKTTLSIGLSRAYNNMYHIMKHQAPDSLQDLAMGGVYGSICHLYVAAEKNDAIQGKFSGRIHILVSGLTASAAEDFLLPFKQTQRATIFGDITHGSTGQPYIEELRKDMLLRVATKRTCFPDGSRFEGVGITPDVFVRNTIEDIRDGFDRVLEAARAAF